MEYFKYERSQIIWKDCLYSCPSEFKKLLTEMRKQGDRCNRYVTSIRYYDIIDKDTFGTDEVCSKGGTVLWTGYCSECSYCQRHKKSMKTNPIIGIHLYSEYQIPEKRDWNIFGKNK